MREIGEFDAVVEGDVIRIPDAYKGELVELGRVHVVLKTQEAPRVRRKGIIEEMTENFVVIPGFKAPTRDEIYDGR